MHKRCDQGEIIRLAGQNSDNERTVLRVVLQGIEMVGNDMICVTMAQGQTSCLQGDEDLSLSYSVAAKFRLRLLLLEI